MKTLTDLYLRSLTGLFFGMVVLGIFFFLPPLFFSLLIAIAGIIMVHEWYKLSAGNKFLVLLTPAYPIVPILFLILLNQNLACRHLLIYLFSIIWTFDTGSYLLGSLIGRVKIAPAISPGKSWEGVAGGCIVALVFFYAVYWIRCYVLDVAPAIDVVLSVVIVALTCALGLAGDLFESAIKRLAHVKDSGSLLPGHGGLLDRFDAILFAVVLFYLARNILVGVLV